MRIPGVSWAWFLIRTGRTRFLIADAWMLFYKLFQEWIFALRYRVFGSLPVTGEFKIKLDTKHPVAFESPDHLIPWGTSRDNSTNKKFVTFMTARLRRENPGTILGAMDLGCSGGQLVKDFKDLGYMAVGLEGSDFSLKHKRANWPVLAGTNLFTCDISKPFQVTTKGNPAKFHLITIWEVLEHITTDSLPMVFENITKHLEKGGYFIATTTSGPDIHEGVDLHQTKWPNAQWREFIQQKFPELVPVDLGLKYYQFVRHNEERSILIYQKK